MGKIEEYRALAQQCRELAAKTTSPVDRRTGLEMAETWERIADERQALQKRLDRAEVASQPKHPPGEPMTLGNMRRMGFNG